MVDSCAHCQTYHPSQRKQHLITTDLPDGPWEKVAADMMSFKGQDYLVVTDYYSRYLELVHMRQNTSSKAVIFAMKNLFARWGIPMDLITDNRPQFNSWEFATFAEEINFSHITSSPRQPHANGAAEKVVHVAKGILKQ